MYSHAAPFKITSLNATTSIVSRQQTIAVHWKNPSSDVPVSSYEVQYRIQNGPWQTLNISGSSLVNSAHIDVVNLIGKTYEVRVRAISPIGAGPFSDSHSTRTYNGNDPLNVSVLFPYFDHNVSTYILQFQKR